MRSLHSRGSQAKANIQTLLRQSNAEDIHAAAQLKKTFTGTLWTSGHVEVDVGSGNSPGSKQSLTVMPPVVPLRQI